MSSGIAIELSNARKKLGPNQALAGVSVRFAAGKLHGLIGPEGAGKTTLLRTLIGLLKLDSGTLTYLADNRPTRLGAIRDQFAYMPQQQSLYPDLSCSEHLDFFRDLYAIPHDIYQERRKELLHITRLEKFQDRRAGQLSGGMYKKLGLMCALLQSPSILLLDEPTNGVDPISRREFWDLLYRLLGGDITIILSTAYMDEAERCGEVHLLESGKLLAEGEPREILHKEHVHSFEELFLRKGAEK